MKWRWVATSVRSEQESRMFGNPAVKSLLKNSPFSIPAFTSGRPLSKLLFIRYLR